MTYDAFSRWRDSSHAAALSPNRIRRPWVLADHPAVRLVLDDLPDLFRSFTLADWQTLERQFWRRRAACPAATDELLVLLAVQIERQRYGPHAG